ncbi:ABC transporter substrate-binding protein [Raoultella ornithinolytica]|uniref:ABC transporter substrate-binding protein n=1 Tax=Raoultella ornithinolytica TaxID=54291 RepID=A0A9Q9MYT8_RAOOR|nr:ABC transporter substrate-binding protein [Raoultella ornithinolytica]MDL4583738.1 ABC transporter substrate-binding protein [Raoultella ornithinolytica]MEB6436567.1 ABC transporter substrate-binding protein [Raoultella ornithinolytica]UXE40224.1 ABC transporter substrate-binding protein [Raoultella ornithinolytica]VTN56409.1 ABC-type taurine transport system, periplasmic component [Raoultella ornithinolytica]HBH8229206.1 ABC transporter substrate-binding protein [Raoultella ornithinolytica
MKIRSRTPWGYRVLGLVALSGMSLAVEAEEKIVLLTSWYAQAEQGGYYQAQATGIYKKYGLEVDIRSGGPQVNGMQLLLSKRADIIIGYDLQLLEGIQRGFQAKAIAAPFQYDPQGLLTHTDVASLEGLKGKTILVSSSGQATWWPWLKGQYQLNDAQARPYTFNIQPFVADDNVAQQAYVSSEVFQVQKAGVKSNFFLFSEHGYPPYGGILIARPETIADRNAALAKFVRASMEGWVSYLNNPAPGNALIKKDNPKMTDDLLAWAVTQIRQHHLIDGGDAASEGWGTMTETRWRKTRDFMVSANLLDAATDWKQAYTTEFVQTMQIKP